VNEYGEKLSALRKAAGISASSLAKHIGVSCAYLIEVERGTRAPLRSSKTVVAAAMLSVDPDMLLSCAYRKRYAFDAAFLSEEGRKAMVQLEADAYSFDDDEWRRLQGIVYSHRARVKAEYAK
jgi:transcriptional regulator with XRE-family HTH domain